MHPMTEQEIKELIERAGLSRVMTVFNSAIEIDPHVPHPDDGYWDAHRALAALLTSCARAEREKVSVWLDRYAMQLRDEAQAEMDDEYQLTLQTVASHFVNAAAALRALD